MQDSLPTSFVSCSEPAPNQRVEANCRPAFPFVAERESGRTHCAPALCPAAVAHPCR